MVEILCVEWQEEETGQVTAISVPRVAQPVTRDSRKEKKA